MKAFGLTLLVFIQLILETCTLGQLDKEESRPPLLISLISSIRSSSMHSVEHTNSSGIQKLPSPAWIVVSILNFDACSECSYELYIDNSDITS